MVGKSCFATLGSANSFGIRVCALTSKGRSVCYFGITGDGCCTWLFHIKQKHGIHQHVFLFPTQRNQLSPDVRWIRDNGLSRMICTHYPGHINLNIKLNAGMLSYILRETSISFLPESVRYYNSQYISLRPVKIHQRKQSHLRSHNTSHSSFFQKSFP